MALKCLDLFILSNRMLFFSNISCFNLRLQDRVLLEETHQWMEVKLRGAGLLFSTGVRWAGSVMNKWWWSYHMFITSPAHLLLQSQQQPVKRGFVSCSGLKRSSSSSSSCGSPHQLCFIPPPPPLPLPLQPSPPPAARRCTSPPPDCSQPSPCTWRRRRPTPAGSTHRHRH